MINEVILEQLHKIERQQNIKILHAVESGSRAWGFASPDSDYDVRFIYLRKIEDYLALGNQRDVIEWLLDDTLDINGWDLQKALRLLHNSNPTLFEWNNSPMIYQTTAEWTKIQQIISRYFLAKTGVHHYLNTAQGNYREYLKAEMVPLKKYFYVLRPILACEWILQRNCPPPMLFSELMGSMLEPAMHPYVEQLLELKTSLPELGRGARIPELNDYIDRQFMKLRLQIDSMPADLKSDWDELDTLFVELVTQQY